MRDILWEKVRSRVPQGMLLPWWALMARAILYPLNFFYWRMGQGTGYQWETDAWVIDGVTFPTSTLRQLSSAHNKIYRVMISDKTVTLTRVV